MRPRRRSPSSTPTSAATRALDLRNCYAGGLVTDWKIDATWADFDHVQAYVDCICQTLTCSTKGCSGVYVLTGAEAVAKCKDEAKQDRRTKLRTETAAQMLAAYERLYPKPPATTTARPRPGGVVGRRL